MAELGGKVEILKATGYSYSFDRALYVNKGLKKAFSVEFIEDHSEAELAKLVRDKAANTGWQFFFNTKPSEAVERELSHMLS